ncbi:MAG: DUF3108 domain-containing protein [Burkholderiaceae bacterium]|nr:DUF3108 domain-containing protein [Burkholderiaceae bacterium]
MHRSLLAITAGVLGLHWLVLAGVPWHMGGALASIGGPVFSTRTLVAPSAVDTTPEHPPAAPTSALTDTHSAKPAPPAQRAAERRQTPSATNAPESPSVASDTPPPSTNPAVADATAPPAAPTPTLENIPPRLTDTDTGGAAPAPTAPTVALDNEAVTIAAASPKTRTRAAETSTAQPLGAIDILLPGAAGGTARTTPPPVRLPAPQRLEFDVAGQAKGFHYSASAQLLWQHDGQHYQARQEVRVLLLGARTQTSVGDVSTLGLLPQRFGDKSRSELAAHFDYGQGRVTFSANTPPANMAPGTQDRLSVFIQLAALLAAGPERYPVGTHIRIATVGARTADVWSFSVEGPETLDLPIGNMRTLKLQRLPHQDFDQKAELWLAPSLGYLPARIRITQSNGEFVDLRLNTSAPP